MSASSAKKGSFSLKVPEGMHVAVVGLGGTGCSVSQMLVRIGLAHLSLIDPDSVSRSNIGRQICYAERDIGRPKAETCREFLSRISPGCEIEFSDDLVTDSNAERVIGKPDILFDCTDNVRSRLNLNRYSVRKRITEIFVSSAYNSAQAKGIIPGITSCLECFANESILANTPCSFGDVAETMPVIAGLLGVNLMFSIISNNYNGEIITLNGKEYTAEKVRIDRNPECRTCGDLR